MSSHTEELSAVRQALSPYRGLRLAMVFGSVASDTARPDSDIDVAVLADRALGAQQKIELIEAIAQATGRPVDLIDLATAGSLVLNQVFRHGTRVLGTPAAQATVATRALIDAADFLPYVQRTLAERRQAWTR